MKHDGLLLVVRGAHIELSGDRLLREPVVPMTAFALQSMAGNDPFRMFVSACYGRHRFWINVDGAADNREDNFASVLLPNPIRSGVGSHYWLLFFLRADAQ